MKKKTIIIILIIVILLIIAGIIIYKNSQKSAKLESLEIATIWGARVSGSGLEGDVLDFESASVSDYNKLARQGFMKGVQDSRQNLDITEVLIGDSFDVKSFINKVNEIFSNNDVLMTVGTLNDESTMYTSMQMNFFKIPMLIPYADGNLSPDSMGADFSVRMTPSSDKYGTFFDALFSSYISDFLNTYVFGGKVLPIYGTGVSVFFMNNFNGNETAVKITQKIIDNGYSVNNYVPFPEDGLLNAVQAAWISDSEKLENSSAVVLIEEDQADVYGISEIWHTWADRGLYPKFFLVGFEPIDIDQDLIDADNVFFIQQYVDIASCPAGIVNRAEAKGYAAGQIMIKALQAAVKTQPPEPVGMSLWFKSEEKKSEIHQDYLDSFRSNIRTALINMKENIPCYGQVDFNADPDDQTSLEVVRYIGKNQYVPVDTDVFNSYVIEQNRAIYGID